MDDSEFQGVDVGAMSKLVAAAKVGDAVAHSEICRQVQGRLNVMAEQQLDPGLRRKLNPSDIVQATLTRMVSGFDDFRGSTSAEFYGWLNSILRNEVNTTRRDLHRDRRDVRREREPTQHSSEDQATDLLADKVAAGRSETPEEFVLRQDKLTRFRQVVQRLPADYALVIELRSIQELPFGEVAVKMDRSVEAVSKLWARALVKLQQELSHIDDSFS